MYKTILILALALILTGLAAQAERMVVRIPSPTPDLFDAFLSQGADIASYKPYEYLDLVVTEAERTQLAILHPGLSVTQTEAQLKQNLLPPRDLPGYHNYAQVVSELMSLQAQYPYLMNTSVIGSGWGSLLADQGIPFYQNFDHDIWAVKVSANVLADEDEPAFYFAGEHHAREPLSTEVCLGILPDLLENYGTDHTEAGII